MHVIGMNLIQMIPSPSSVAKKKTVKQVKDINLPVACQCMEVMNERLCVGYQSGFAIYSVQGESAVCAELASAIGACASDGIASCKQISVTFEKIL